MLSDYFDGKLEMNHWEELKYNANQEKMKDPTAGEPKTLMRCINCNPLNPPNPDCPICMGSGKIMIQSLPVNNNDMIQEMMESVMKRKEENDE